MPALKKISPLLFLLVICTFIISVNSGCVSSKKNAFYEKRLSASSANTQRLGRNKYYFSKDYQKRLGKNYKRR